MYSIVMCTDQNYAQYIPVLIESISENTDEQIKFFIIYSSITDESKQRITDIAQIHNFQTQFIFFNPEKELNKFGTTVKSFRSGFDAYSRIFLPALLKDFNVSACLYLDVDTIANQNIDELLKLINKTELLAGIRDNVSIDLHLKFTHPDYINSGVLIMNLSNLEKTEFTQKCLTFMKENEKFLELGDQDTINNIYPHNSIQIIPDKFNQFKSKTSLNKKGVILHFTGPYKPWMPNCRWRYKKCIWVKYKIFTDLYLSGKKPGRLTKSLISFLLVNCRGFINIIFFMRLLTGNLKK